MEKTALGSCLAVYAAMQANHGILANPATSVESAKSQSDGILRVAEFPKILRGDVELDAGP